MTMTFNTTTAPEVKNILERYSRLSTRVRIWYGDENTGKSWLETYDVMGTIGKSTGTKKIPLLIHNRRSLGGGAIITDKIIRIDDMETRRTVYKHQKFNVPEMTIKHHENELYPFSVVAGGETQVSFMTKQKAQNYIDFQNGKRYSL